MAILPLPFYRKAFDVANSILKRVNIIQKNAFSNTQKPITGRLNHKSPQKQYLICITEK